MEHKNLILGSLAAAGSALAGALGGWDGALALLLTLMAADCATGWLLAAVWKKSSKSATGALESRAGWKGLCRKGAALVVVWVGVMLDTAMGTGYIRTAVCLFFAGNEGLSLLENIGLMGVPCPKFLQEALEVLREEGEAGHDGG